MKIDEDLAVAAVREAAADGLVGYPDPAWMTKIERLSQLCEGGGSKTHIAFFGTTTLARAVSARADLFAIKPSRVPENPNAYSARSLCHDVLVPLSAELGFSLGVTGREPLNNQPYFRITRLGDDTPVRAGGRPAFDYMLELVQELQELQSDAGRAALCAFIAVRRRYQPRYVAAAGEKPITPEQLAVAIRALVSDNTEGGKRAQAVVAGLMDVFAGVERVESGRINDPSRNYPGDVCVRDAIDPDIWGKAIEVRDKPVSESDIRIFGNKCVAMGVRDAAVMMAADRQPDIDTASLMLWADGLGLGLTLFQGWPDIVDQTLFWADAPKPVAANLAVGFIRDRLIGVEASPQAVESWDKLTH